MAIVGFKNLCAPAMFYLAISFISLAVIAFFNFGNEHVYCVGYYSCPVSSIYLIFLIKIIYVIFWTWILNLICRSGLPIVSWLLVLLPLLMFFTMIGLFIVRSPL
jgi:hypothetical protein